jgi:murein L,D-transpeptidase YcbB/YkuD
MRLLFGVGRAVGLGLGVLISLSVVGQEERAETGIALSNPAPLSLAQTLEQALEARILALQSPPQDEVLAQSTVNQVAQAVSSFYQQRGYRPAWAERARLEELINALEGLSADGLDPDDYSIEFLRQIHSLLQAGQRPSVSAQVEWELLATNAYLRALYHLFNGKVDPARLDSQWNFELHQLAPSVVAGLMNEGVGTRRIAAIFAQARPQHPIYTSLQAGLARYRQLAAAGGWPSLPAGPTLKHCMVAPEVALLRQRLLVTGEYQPVSSDEQAQAVAKCIPPAPLVVMPPATTSSANPLEALVPEAMLPDAVQAQTSSVATSDTGPEFALETSSAPSLTELAATSDDPGSAQSSVPAVNKDEVYDEYLVAAVKQFQRDQYLEDDGAIGPATRAALNVSAQSRVDQIRVNLDRARWLLHNIPQELLLVDVAGFKITYFKAGEPVWKSRVQVGMSYRTTPIFKSEVNYITLNPTWTVPPTILRKDILPKLRKDLSYLREHKIRVLDANGQQLDPATVDWNRPGNVILRQDAGADAALGKAVIRFPNPYSVYLHDTPHQKLFSKSQRAFSSGCIRVERALELVELLLAQTPDWDAAAINKALATGKTRNVTLTKRVPIMLAYWTVDAVSDSKVAFKPDIYARDAAVLAGLNQRVSQPRLSLISE